MHVLKPLHSDSTMTPTPTTTPANNIMDANSNYASSDSSSSRSSMSSLSSDHLLVARNATGSDTKCDEHPFNTGYFKAAGKAKLKKKCHSMKVQQGGGSSEYTQLLNPGPLAKRAHSDTLCHFSPLHKKFKQHVPEATEPGQGVNMKNLSIEVAVSSTASPSSTCSYSSLVSTTTSVCHNQTTLFSQVEGIKQLIRQASSEQTVKSLFSELTASVASFILGQQSANTSRSAGPLAQVEIKVNRELIVAYCCLMDGAEESPSTASYLSLMSDCASPYESRIKAILSRVYANVALAKTKPVSVHADEKLFSSFDVADFSQSSCFPEFSLGFGGMQDYEVLNLPNLNEVSLESMNIGSSSRTATSSSTTTTLNTNTTTELKTLHFLLLLFTSLISLDGFISQLDGRAENEMSADASYCQRFLMKLLDRVCEDKNVKTRILLSVPEIELF